MFSYTKSYPDRWLYKLAKKAGKTNTSGISHEIFTGDMHDFMMDIIYIRLDMFVSNNIFLQFL